MEFDKQILGTITAYMSGLFGRMNNSMHNLNDKTTLM